MDDIPYRDKKNESLFIGSSTGNFDNNTRAKYCIKCLKSSTHHGYIHNLCQNDKELWDSKYPDIKQTIHDTILIKDQLKYKLLINIDGNTSCWSRLYWQMNSNSIPVYIERNKEDIQFFDYYDNSNTFIHCTLDESFSVMDSILQTNNNEILEDTNRNGQEYCRQVFGDYLKNPKVFLQNIINSTLKTFL